MALFPRVAGPIVVEYSAAPDAGTGFQELGTCTESGRPSVSNEWLNQEVLTDENGDEPIEIVHVGRLMTLEFVINKIDLTQLGLLLDRAIPGGDGGEGESGVIGSPWIGYTTAGVPDYDTSGATFSVRFNPRIGGARQITFPQCVFIGEGVREFNKGNDGTQWAFTCRVLREQQAATPHATNDFFYTVA